MTAISPQVAGASAPGWWIPGQVPLVRADAVWSQALSEVSQALAWVWSGPGKLAVGVGGVACFGGAPPAGVVAYPLQAHLPALHPSGLGSASFRARHGLRYAYIAGAMANGIGSVAIVEAMAREGMLGVFGAAGLAPDVVEAALHQLASSVGGLPYGSNLIHSPDDPALEDEIVSLYLRHGLSLISASAYLDLTLPLVRYRLAGIHVNNAGHVVCPNRILAKVSRVEVARHFWSPAPERFLRALVEQGHLTPDQASLAAHVPMAEDIIAESDSGGHTDNQAAMVLLPVMLTLREECRAAHNFAMPLHVGLAGGIATPDAAAAAYAMGADFIVTGSINQGCVEAGTSPVVRSLLAEATQADVVMAPAADMFEMGVQVQVLKWGTMFGVKAKKLYDLYRSHESLDALPATEVTRLERDYFRCSLAEAWAQTAAYFATRDPAQNERAARDPKHKMALVFRAYLGRASRWANAGEPTRKLDYQIWCGPAMGAFNAWTKGSFLEEPGARRVATVGLNLMLGACVSTRRHTLQTQGVPVPDAHTRFAPMPLAHLHALLGHGPVSTAASHGELT